MTVEHLGIVCAAQLKARRGVVPLNLLPGHGNKNTITGVSEVSLKQFLGGNWKPLIDLIVAGDIKGVGSTPIACASSVATISRRPIARQGPKLSTGGIPSFLHLSPAASW